MTVKHFAIVLVILILNPRVAGAQSVGVAGVVVDARTGRPLSGVLIHVDDQPAFAESDAAGRFALELPAGRYTLVVSLIGYALVRAPLTIDAAGPPVRIALHEGAGAFEEHVTVSAASTAVEPVPAAATLHGRDLQALRGVTLDDPLRALQALPSAVATDDFYSEFAVRGLDFSRTQLVVDGFPSRYLMHAVHGVSDGGSIAMLNSDAVGSMALRPGSYPQRIGRRLGAEVEVTAREGDRRGFRSRGGLSGTSATVLAEGPMAGGRGSWLVSGRRSYLDLLMKRIDEDNSLAFGFNDAQAKLVLDLTPRHQLQALAIVGASQFNQRPNQLGPNDEASVSGRSWLSGVTWRYTPAATIAITQRVYATGLGHTNINVTGDTLDRRRAVDAGWRGAATVAPRDGWLIEVGGDAQHLSGQHLVRRSLNDAPTVSTIGDYRASGSAASAYAVMTIRTASGFTLTPGARVDRWRPTNSVTTSPWLNAEAVVADGTRLRAGAGVYRQFADIEQIHGVRGGGAALRPETAHHLDLGLEQRLPLSSTLQVSWFARDEREVLWTPGAEPRRLADGGIQPGRGDARWINALDGRARGVELLLRRDAPAGLSGWAGYAYTRHDYSTATESFSSDADQRHGLSLFGRYAISNRASVGAKFRYGSNYPRIGYIAERPTTVGPPVGPPVLIDGEPPRMFWLTTARNTLRLPAYARLDVRADRTFTWSRRRITVFAEVANALNRPNVRNVPYGVGRNGWIDGGLDTLMPILPSAGFVIEF